MTEKAEVNIQEIASRHGIEELRPELAEALQKIAELPDECLPCLQIIKDALDALRIDEAREAILDALVPMSKE